MTQCSCLIDRATFVSGDSSKSESHGTPRIYVSSTDFTITSDTCTHTKTVYIVYSGINPTAVGVTPSYPQQTRIVNSSWISNSFFSPTSRRPFFVFIFYTTRNKRDVYTIYYRKIIYPNQPKPDSRYNFTL